MKTASTEVGPVFRSRRSDGLPRPFEKVPYTPLPPWYAFQGDKIIPQDGISRGEGGTHENFIALSQWIYLYLTTPYGTMGLDIPHQVVYTGPKEETVWLSGNLNGEG